MSMTVTADALGSLEAYLGSRPEVAKRSARMALNTVAQGKGMRRLKTAVDEEIAFPGGYVNDKLYVKRKALDERLETVIAARTRPTSLARFATMGQTIASSKAAGVTVQVHHGVTRKLPAFFMRLRVGKILDADNYNLGLAIRLKPGERIRGKKKPYNDSDATLFLLYGPSVDQVFREVAYEQSEPILLDVETEFLRNFARLSE